MNEDVKNEFCNVLFCYGCLSNDRKTVPLGDYTEMFYNLMNSTNEYINSSDDVRLCWECVAMLRKVKQFRSQIQEAQSKLVQYMYQLETSFHSLSRLKSVHKNSYDQQYKYDSYIKSDKDEITAADTEIFNDNEFDYQSDDTYCEENDFKMDTSFNNASVSNDIKEQKINDKETRVNNKNVKETVELKNVSVKVTRCKANSVKSNFKAKNKSKEKAKVKNSVKTTKVTDKSVKCNTRAIRKSVKENIEIKDIVPTIKKEDNELVTSNDNSRSKRVKDKINYTELIKKEDSETTKNDNSSSKKEKPQQDKIREPRNYIKKPRNYIKVPAPVKVNLKDAESYFEKCYLTTEEIDQYHIKLHRLRKLGGKLIKCTTCNIRFIKGDDYKRHRDTVHFDAKKSAQKCSLCRQTYPTIDVLKHHWKMDHQKYNTCKLCGDYVRSDSLKYHLVFEHMNLYKCTKCKREYGCLWKYDVHYKKHHMKYTCDHCGNSFSSRTAIENHSMRYHMRIKCSICSNTLSGHKSYNQHCRAQHPETLNINEDKELAYCVECDKQYPSTYAYHAHIKFHSKVKEEHLSEPCSVCNKVFNSKHFLKRHFNKYHAFTPDQYCRVCDKYYTAIKAHNRHVHLKIPMVKDKLCDICGRGFSTKRILTNHRRTHTGERPFKCEYCDACFAQKVAMTTHMKSQHKHVFVKADISNAK